jgi:hypothetical protein
MAKAFSLLLAILCHIVLADRPLPSATVQCETTKGDIKIEVYRDWAPLGADRFLELVRDNYYTDIGFYRCVKRWGLLCMIRKAFRLYGVALLIALYLDCCIDSSHNSEYLTTLKRNIGRGSRLRMTLICTWV